MIDDEPAEGEAPATHPRHHSLTMAAAKHLHTAGHITGKLHKQILRDAKGKLKEHKASKATPAIPFGSLTP